MPKSDERWGAKLKVLQESIEHHIEEEERRMFPIARGVLDREALHALGREDAGAAQGQRRLIGQSGVRRICTPSARGDAAAGTVGAGDIRSIPGMPCPPPPDRSSPPSPLVLLVGCAPAAAQGWPSAFAPNVIQVSKASGLEDPGGLPDAAWIHLHRGHHSAPDAVQATLRVRLYLNNSGYDEVAITQSGLTQIRFLVHGVDVSGWLPLDRDDFTWLLHIDNAGLNGLADGIHDISTEVQGARARQLQAGADLRARHARTRGQRPGADHGRLGVADADRRRAARAVRARRRSAVARLSARARGRAVPRAAGPVRHRSAS